MTTNIIPQMTTTVAGHTASARAAGFTVINLPDDLPAEYCREACGNNYPVRMYVKYDTTLTTVYGSCECGDLHVVGFEKIDTSTKEV